MTIVWSVLILTTVMALTEGGYYKIRPPHPPPPPPPSLYYGPSPPHHFPHRHYPPPPPHYRGPHHRNYHPRYHKPPPPPPYPAWKPPSFRAPVVKETFSTPQSVYGPPPYLKEEDKGPIHTIPAPNLGPADRPQGLYQPAGYKGDLFKSEPFKGDIFKAEGFNGDFFKGEAFKGDLFKSEGFKGDLFKSEGFKADGYKTTGSKTPLHSTEQDLASVLRHGLTKVNVPHSSGYQVTEDPAAASPYNTAPHSYFAPDPDPEVPALKIPPTNDPHSKPTNGQVPLDLYLQQQAESHSQYGHYHQPTEQSNTLTPQELFNLLNYQPGQPSTLQQQVQILLPQQSGQLWQDFGQQQLSQQHLPVQDVTPKHFSHQQFAQPQFQTFNYEEQGNHQGLYGGGLGFGLGSSEYSNEHHKDLFDEDNDVAGSEKEERYQSVVANEFDKQQRKEDDSMSKEKEKVIDSGKSQFPEKHSSLEGNVYHPNHLSNNIQNEKVIAHEQKQESSIQMSDTAAENVNTQATTSARPDNNVQLQKSIQIYENTYANNEEMMRPEKKKINESSMEYTDERKFLEDSKFGTIDDEVLFRNVEEHNSDSIPYGTKIRPKRY